MFFRAIKMLPSYRGCVLHVSANCYGDDPPRGSERQVWEMLGSTDRKYVLVARNAKNTLNIRTDGFMTFVLLPRLFSGQWIFLFYNPVVFLVCLLIRPHIVLAQCPVLGGLGGALYKMLRPIRLVVELHGQHFFSPVSRTFWHRFGHFVFLKSAGFVMDKADAVRALSVHMASQVSNTYQINRFKICVVPPRFDSKRFFLQKTDFCIGKVPKFISVGGLTPVKNYMCLVDVLEQAEIQCELRLVGTGPLYSELLAKSDRLKFVDLRLCGRLSAEEVASELASSDIYIQFSLAEGMPRAIMEAMYVGTPVLSRDVGSVRELMEPMTSQCVFQSDSLFINQLKDLLCSEEQRKHLSYLGRNRISARFEPQSLLAQYRKMVFDS